jgi:hypothetical protein
MRLGISDPITASARILQTCSITGAEKGGGGADAIRQLCRNCMLAMTLELRREHHPYSHRLLIGHWNTPG